MTTLITGAAGYIASHAVRRMLAAGHRVVALDDLSRGNRAAIHAICDHDQPGDRLTFVEGSIADRTLVEALIREHAVTSVLHFAALAYVRESVEIPLRYYDNNTAGSIALLQACDAAGTVERFVFSSTCATYGEPPADLIPITETCPQHPINPYGHSKLAFEQVLTDYSAVRAAKSGGGQSGQGGRPFAAAMLRYFNVAGSARDGVIGEDHDPETHLIPIVLQAALGQRPHISVFGTDHDTPDGTCVRDYIHVEDLVDAHAVVLEALEPGGPACAAPLVYNLGLGRGISVREIIIAAKRVTGVDFEVIGAPRHPADPPVLYCDASKITRELGWSPKITDLDEIIRTAWDWMRRHPQGYRTSPETAAKS
jgi:UDP-glucose-4-epimerase GalE